MRFKSTAFGLLGRSFYSALFIPSSIVSLVYRQALVVPGFGRRLRLGVKRAEAAIADDPAVV